MNNKHSWVAGQFHITGCKGKVAVAGWLYGALAIDFRIITEDDGTAAWGWCVTHTPTGLGIFVLAMGEREVRSIVEELAAYTDWGVVSIYNSMFIKARVCGLMRRFPGLVFRDDQTIPPWAEYERGGQPLRVVK